MSIIERRRLAAAIRNAPDDPQVGTGESFLGSDAAGNLRRFEPGDILATPANLPLLNGSINALAFTDYPSLINGSVQPLSGVFPTLAAAQAFYPRITSLTQSLDWAMLQTALDAWSLTGGELIIPPKVYNLGNTGALLPAAFSGQADRTATISGHGAILKSSSAVTLLGNPVPAGISAAITQTSRKIHIDGLTFLGSSGAGQVGLQSIASYGLEVNRCNFTGLDTGLDLIFALNAKVSNCYGTQNLTYDFVARDASGGVIAGASADTSGSNGTTFEHCRSFGSAGQTAQFFVKGSDGVALNDCITEGGNPVNAISFNWNGGTTIKTFTVSNHHAENAPTGAQVRAIAGGNVFIEKLFAQGSAKLVDGSGSGAATVIHVKKVPYINAVPAFNHGATGNVHPQWVFESCGQYGTYDPLASANWVGGIVPTRLLHLGMTAVFGNIDAAMQGGGSLLVRANNGIVSIDAPGYRGAGQTGVYLGGIAQVYLGSLSAAANPPSPTANYGAWDKNETARQLRFTFKNNAGTTYTLTLPYTQTKLAAVTVNNTQTTIVHGLGYIPTRITVEPTSAGQIWRSADSDSTNIYLTADTNGRTADIYVG